MDTKWKNKIGIGILAFMFTFGVNGILYLLFGGNNYIHKDYFHTPDFQGQLDEFAGYLTVFELNNITLEEAKAAITVSEDDINEHRYRYGKLDEQIAELHAQYEVRIEEALASDNQKIADTYIAERDEKIEDITNNFNSDEYVRPKVVKEKEQKIKELFVEVEKYRPYFSKYKADFTYYFENSLTGKVYTNLVLTEDITVPDLMNQKTMQFLTDYSISKDSVIYYGMPIYEQLVEDVLYPETVGMFEGYIGIANSATSANSIMANYENYKQKQMILIICSLASVLSLILCFLFIKKAKFISSEIETWKPHYNKLPMDIRIILFLTSGMISLFIMALANDPFYYIYNSPLDFIGDIVTYLVIGTVFWALSFIQWRLLALEFKNLPNVKQELKSGLLNRGWKNVLVLFNKTVQKLKEAFLNQSVGSQFFIVLASLFGLGLAAVTTFIGPVFVLFYIILLSGIGIPLILALIDRVGYFNKIVKKTNELAEGKLGEDLDVSGKSVLAELARNINQLKQGVKASQNEQAKSERLKTELITNVSHDLRTPLTSIITYTDLLKANALSAEEQAAYLEIIDRKSKRLKVLIDDLFEVSKMASGTIELKKEKVDLVQLLQQSLAEHDNTIADSSLQFRVTKNGGPIFVLVDGQKFWRVFDNLIGNILKYSLENSRVYIAIDSMDNQCNIIFKNVSKYELGENNNELFERFKRGDESRHTEGSGLGLAIAKSIIDLHGGTLDIDTDGDLFKVKITLNLENE